jgi:tRNA(fMet)-specific endonuclease VapC
MTGNRFALDTNIVSAWLKGEGPIADKIDAAESVFLPIIVIGELYYGAAFSAQVAKNTQDVKKITEQYPLLSLDEDTTIIYGSIKTRLRKKGKPIPENDIWIAAIAIQNDLALVTRDGHFNEIEGLSLVAW